VRRAGWSLAAAASVLALGAVVVATRTGGPASAAAPAPSVRTALVEEGPLSAAVSQDGTLTYRARPDGSPFAVINHARGTYTGLPEAGDEIRCGAALYRVDDEPVLLLCGVMPAYRALRAGDRGRDVRQLNQNLHVAGDAFTARTQQGLAALQRRAGAPASGELALGDAVFLPEAVRIAAVRAAPGGAAQPGTRLLDATTDTLQVQVNLDPSDQGSVRRGDPVRITLPGATIVAGRVEGFGRIATTPEDQGATAQDATISTFIRLDDPRRASGLDRAPVGVEITTAGVDHAVSVPVTALVGKAGGGFAVEVVRAGTGRDLVPVRLGLFDTGGGRVQVEGDVRAGDRVAVPSL
jgi:hypothetical protein